MSAKEDQDRTGLSDMSRVTSFGNREIRCFYRKQKFGILNPFLKKIYHSWGRVSGRFSYEDQIKIACVCEPPMFFLNNGIMIAHAYGITLSADEIGCDVYIGQNVTLGTNGKNMELGGNTTGHKPRIGNLVRIYTHAIVSGEISIGDCVLIAGGAIVTKDVPNKSIVYERNQIKPLKQHHIKYLKSVLYHCERQYVKIPGLMYRGENMYINNDYLKKRELLLNNIKTDKFASLVDELF